MITAKTCFEITKPNGETFTRDTYALVKKIISYEKYSKVTFVTSEKNAEDKYDYSNWGFYDEDKEEIYGGWIFIGHAHNKIKNLGENTKIKSLEFRMDLKPYIDGQGEKKYPKYPNLVILDFEEVNSQNGEENKTTTKKVEKPVKSAKITKKEVVEEDDDLPL